MSFKDKRDKRDYEVKSLVLLELVEWLYKDLKQSGSLKDRNRSVRIENIADFLGIDYTEWSEDNDL